MLQCLKFVVWKLLCYHCKTTTWLYMQVFISYGRKSNGDLLLSYGFVPREGTNPTDSVELSFSLKKSDKCYKEKLEALKKHGLSTWVLLIYMQSINRKEIDVVGHFQLIIWERLCFTSFGTYLSCTCYRPQCFPLQITGWPVELMAYAYLAVSPPSLNKQFGEVCITCLLKFLIL